MTISQYYTGMTVGPLKSERFVPCISHYACHYHNHTQSTEFSGQLNHCFGCSQSVNFIMSVYCRCRYALPSGPTVNPYTVTIL